MLIVVCQWLAGLIIFFICVVVIRSCYYICGQPALVVHWRCTKVMELFEFSKRAQSSPEFPGSYTDSQEFS